MIALLIQQEKHELAMQEIEKAMIQFGIDDGILSAGLEIRKRIGPLEINKSKRKKATLCVCMIVKNEEQHLARCLMSVKPVADEIIVVDTGSTDKTKAIASALGATVFDFPWTNDFSEARNYSLSKASGDSILVLDADEIISPLDHAALRSLIQQADKRFAYSMTTRNYTYQVASQNWTANDGKYPQEEAASGWLPSPKVRMFVNDKRIRFVNAVHELVEPTLKDIGIRIKNCSIPVHHYGRLNQDRVLAKGEEYYRLGKKKVLETKGDYKALKELAIQASELEKYAEAISLWENLLKLNPTDSVAYLNLGFAHIKLSQYGQGLISSQKAWELDPNSKEAGLNYAGCELIIGDVKRAIFVLNKLLQTYPDYPPALARLAASHLVSGEREQGLQCLERLRRLRFDCAGVLSKHAQAFLSQSRFEQAIVLLEIGIETNNMNADTQALLAECHRQKEGRIPSEIMGSSGMLPAEAAPGQSA
jgi:glycosyltransferase involved in cell wall biosynthesis